MISNNLTVLKQSDIKDTGVQQFYSGQTVLLTGATGFLGKAIIDKLLRTCPNLHKLLLLIRPKKEKTSQQRIDELFKDPVFNRLKSENPDFRKSVAVIHGDILLPNIGLSESDKKIINDEVTVVLHGAATVRFDEKLVAAVNINVLGTKRILELCSECKKLKVIVHISTAFSNCNSRKIEEAIHPSPISGEKLIHLIKNLPEIIVEICAPVIMNGWPNTYVFTKQIAEDIVRQEAKNNKLPIAIFRPAIVVGSNSEPVPGWIDNVYGPTGVIAAVGAGLMRTMHVDSDCIAELVPVDMSVNAVLTVAWNLACNRTCNKIDELVPVYNYVSSNNNPLLWGNFIATNVKHGSKVPVMKSIWYPSIMTTKYHTLFYMYCYLFHIIPAIIIDIVLMAADRKPQALKVYRKIQKFMVVISNFSTREWDFIDDNVNKLLNRMTEKDKLLFNFDIRTVDWDLFFKNNIDAIRIFLFKETPETIPIGQERHFKLYILHRSFQAIIISLMIWLLWKPIFGLLSGFLI